MNKWDFDESFSTKKNFVAICQQIDVPSVFSLPGVRGHILLHTAGGTIHTVYPVEQNELCEIHNSDVNQLWHLFLQVLIVSSYILVLGL